MACAGFFKAGATGMIDGVIDMKAFKVTSQSILTFAKKFAFIISL